MGVTVDHIFSMTVPLLGGIIWKASGYEVVFLLAGMIAVVTAITAFGIPRPTAPAPRPVAAATS